MGFLANSYIGAAGAKAFADGMSPERFAERSEAYRQKEQSDQELASLKKNKDLNLERTTLELENVIEQQKAQMRENNKQTSYSAFGRYDADGDTRHLNSMLEDFNGRGVELYGKLARVDKLNTTDIPMLKEMGLSESFIDQVLDPESPLHRSYVKQTLKDGSIEFGDIDALKGITKYDKYATKDEIDRLKDARMLEQLEFLGLEVSRYSADAFRAARAEVGPDVDPKSPEFREAYLKHYDKLTKSGLLGGSRPHRLTEAQDYARRELEALGITEDDPTYNEQYNDKIEEYRNLAKPSKVKQMDIADNAQQELEDMQFLDMDISNLNSTQTNKIETTVRKLEQLGGAELGPDTRKNLLRIRGLSHLGDTASDLTEKETGLLDNLWFGVKKYIFNEAPPGTDAAAAYALYRNVARHAQFGSVLPAGEIKSFAEAFGSMGMQVGPVLTMLRESLLQLKNDYSAISDLENPYVMKWRTGMGELELEDTINKLDERIAMIDIEAKDLPIPLQDDPAKSNSTTVLTPEVEAGLDAIYQGVKE